MSDFRFRELRLPEDAAPLLELLRLGFPETVGLPENTTEFIDWKFGSSTSAQTSEVGFDADGRMVSFYGVIPMRYTVAGQERTLGLVCDVMSHPEVRRRGLFAAAGSSALQRLESASVDAVTGYPIRDDVMPGHLKVGWTAHFPLPVYVAATGRRVSGSLLKSVGGAAGSLLPRVAGARSSSAREVDRDELFQTASTLSSAAAAAGLNIAARDEAFLAWRLARPGADYVHIVAESRHGRACAVASRTTLRDIPALAVLDVVSSDAQASRSVLHELWRHACRAGLPVVAFCANPATARRLRLGQAGFARTPLTFRLIGRSTGSALAATVFDRDADWHLTWLDADTL